MKQCTVIEIVGVAGAGKSTLADLLGQRNENLVASVSVWGLPRVLLLRAAVSLLPKLPALYRLHVTNTEVGLLVRAIALHEFLNRASSHRSAKIVVDEGAIFAFAKLQVAALERERIARPCLLIENLTQRCTRTLNLIVHLDASDEILIKRICARDKPHRMKHRTETEIAEFLARYRAAYDEVISRISASSNIKIVRFDTHREPLERIAEHVATLMRSQTGNEIKHTTNLHTKDVELAKSN